MTKIKVIKAKNLPTRFPIFQTITIWLFLDRLKASSLIYGIVGTLVVLLWILAIGITFFEEATDIFVEKT